MYLVYILHNLKTGKYYTGYTSNLQRRLREHSRRKTKSLRAGGPFKLVYYEEHLTQQEAYRREREIKSYKSGEAFQKLIEAKKVVSSPPLRPLG